MLQLSEDRNGFGNLSDSQVTTLRNRFNINTRGSGFPQDFETWNKLRQSEGFLCRFDEDCQWIMAISTSESAEATSLSYLEEVTLRQDNRKFVCKEEEVNASTEVSYCATGYYYVFTHIFTTTVVWWNQEQRARFLQMLLEYWLPTYLRRGSY